jgi:hypothetical protein
VKAVEEKLAAYGAARNILDLFEMEVRQAMINERGEHFSIKSMSYMDTDEDPDGNESGYISPDGDPTTLQMRYKLSRRYADGVNFVKPQPGSWFRSNNRRTRVTGSMPHPMTYSGAKMNPSIHEAWRVSLRSTLLYPRSADPAYRYEPPPTRAQMLDDLSLVETSMLFYARNNDPVEAGSFGSWRNERPNLLQPGKEIRLAVNHNGDYAEDYTRKAITGIALMDMDIAWWDDVDFEFKELREGAVIYFAPPPKAIRITITVCDRKKRKAVTLQRVIQIPGGSGDGVVSNHTATLDTDYFLPEMYNREKNLTALEPGL